MTGPVGPGGPGPADTLAALKSGRLQGRNDRLLAATQLFEATFYQEMFKAMRETIPEGGAIPGSSGQEMFESLFDQAVAEAGAAQNERGIGMALYRHFLSILGDAQAGGEP